VRESVDVAIVGGGPAGAATAIRLAQRGYSVVVLERHREPRWRACGVFTSPLVRHRLLEIGLSQTELDKLAQAISAMELVSTRGAHSTLQYTNGFACGFDRVRLDARLLALAEHAGADVGRGCVVMHVDVASSRPNLTYSDLAAPNPTPVTVHARVIVGADGGGSRVAHAAGVMTNRNLLGRSAVTFHQTDLGAADSRAPQVGRFVLGSGWYVGLAPVPGNRVNVGIVVPTVRLHAGLHEAIARVLESAAPHAGGLMAGDRVDVPQVAGALEHHVSRRAGVGWLLVGDAAGFIDPLTGEGLHRSLVTAGLGANAIHRALSGDRGAMADYDRQVRSRYRSKDVFSLFLQAFAANPQVLDYALHRLGTRPSVQATLTDVLADRTVASRALDPRFMARLLAP